MSSSLISFIYMIIHEEEWLYICQLFCCSNVVGKIMNLYIEKKNRLSGQR